MSSKPTPSLSLQPLSQKDFPAWRDYGVRAFEEEAAKLGARYLEQHVFAFNETAKGLYDSLGYQTTDYTMSKKLAGPEL